MNDVARLERLVAVAHASELRARSDLAVAARRVARRVEAARKLEQITLPSDPDGAPGALKALAARPERLAALQREIARLRVDHAGLISALRTAIGRRAALEQLHVRAVAGAAATRRRRHTS